MNHQGSCRGGGGSTLTYGNSSTKFWVVDKNLIGLAACVRKINENRTKGNAFSSDNIPQLFDDARGYL